MKDDWLILMKIKNIRIFYLKKNTFIFLLKTKTRKWEDDLN